MTMVGLVQVLPLCCDWSFCLKEIWLLLFWQKMTINVFSYLRMCRFVLFVWWLIVFPELLSLARWPWDSRNWASSHGHTVILISHSMRIISLFYFFPSNVFPHLLVALILSLFCLWLAYPDINPNQSLVLMPKSHQPTDRQKVPTNQRQSMVSNAITSQEAKTNFSRQTANNTTPDCLSAGAEGQTKCNHLILIWIMLFFYINKICS